MKTMLGGVRGTAVVTAPSFSGFGGDTTSFLVRGGTGEVVLVDFGTGVRNFGGALKDTPGENILALLTHYHLDHMNGFPVFQGVYDSSVSLHIAGPSAGGVSAEDVFSGMLARPFWPIQIDMLQARIEFETLPEQCAQPRLFAGLAIRWLRVHHPGGCMAYRIEEPSTGHSLVIATDMEWGLSTEAEQAAFLKLCEGAGVLFFDSHFTAGNYEAHRGWGHSTWQQGVEIAGRAGVKRLVAIHHAPEADDVDLQAREAAMKAVMPEAEFGRQGGEYAAD